MFETVLFYPALAANGIGSALLRGFVTGLDMLSVIAAIFMRTGAGMPIGKFFSLSSVLVSVLTLPVLGIYPTIQVYGAQLALLLAAGLVFGFNLVKARGSYPDKEQS